MRASLLLVEGTANRGGDGRREGNGEGDSDLPGGDGVAGVALLRLGLHLLRLLLVDNHVRGDGLGEEGDDGRGVHELEADAGAAADGAVRGLLLGVLGGLLDHAVAALGAGLEEDQRGVQRGADAGVGVHGRAAEEVEGDGHLDAGLLGGDLRVHLVRVVQAARDEAKAKGVDGDAHGALAQAEEGVLGGGHFFLFEIHCFGVVWGLFGGVKARQ